MCHFQHTITSNWCEWLIIFINKCLYSLIFLNDFAHYGSCAKSGNENKYLIFVVHILGEKKRKILHPILQLVTKGIIYDTIGIRDDVATLETTWDQNEIGKYQFCELTIEFCFCKQHKLGRWLLGKSLLPHLDSFPNQTLRNDYRLTLNFDFVTNECEIEW